MITDQVHPKTGKVIRRVEVLSVDEKQETATVKALNWQDRSTRSALISSQGPSDDPHV